MSFRDHWRKWWARLARSTDAADRAASRSAGSDPSSKAVAHGSRAEGQVRTGSGVDLGIEVDPGESAPTAPRRRQVRRAGFDPYSNDAGYDKPRSWDDVDPR